MIKNYIKVAIRNLLKRKVFSLINILGLAIGMAVCLVIILFIQSELGYDSYHKNGDNVYRIALERKYPGRSTSYAIIPPSIGDAIKHEFPEVLECTRMFDFTNAGTFPFTIKDRTYEESKVFAVDSNFFKVFTAETLVGDPFAALAKLHSAVINKATADKLYGGPENALGKSFEINQNNIKVSYVIGAIVKDWPSNMHFNFNMLISSITFPQLYKPNYTGFSSYNYLLLKNGASANALEQKFPLIIKKYVAGDIGKNFGVTFEQFQAAGNGYHYYLQPIKQIHLTSNLEAELSPNGNLNTIYIFIVIAAFILVLACINFLNLSTSLSLDRAKEVGIRKTFGSERKSIINQFLMESVLISILSLVLSLGLVFLFIPLFNQLSGKTLNMGYFFDLMHLTMLLLFGFLTGILAGIYPAFILSGFNPITVLKGRFKSNKSSLLLRNVLVVFQFSISIILIIATITVNGQIGYMLGDKLGFRKDHVILVNNAFGLQKNTSVFTDQLANIPGVTLVSKASTVPGEQNFFGITYQPLGSKKPMTGRGIVVDENFANMLNLEMLKGRFFSKDFPSDTLSLVLNETAVIEMGLKDPIGQQVTSPDINKPDGSPVVFTVVGVVHDFHFQSLHQKITPLIFNYSNRNAVSNLITVRVKSDNFQSIINQIGQRWSVFVKEQPFHYSFLDQKVAEQYSSEQRTQRLFTVFSVLAIFIACIGLMGLAAYATQQRVREIGIRKILGASISGIITMLSIDFLKLILWAVLFAFPLAFWCMHSWLQNFAYRINISWWTFLLAGSISILIAMLTISFQAIKAAVANPVKSLRSE